MIKRRIFKKNKKKYIYIYTFFIIIFLTLFYYYYFNYNSNIFYINKNINDFYIIPIDKKGKIIANKDKKILDFDSNLNIINYPFNITDYKFSIQLKASTEYNNILQERLNYINNYSLNASDLYIIAFKHSLGIDYLLLYKNFENNEIAFNYCKNYLNFTQKCLIVNVQNID